MNKLVSLAEKLSDTHSLSVDEYLFLLENRNEEFALYLAKIANRVRQAVYSNKVYIRGLIEISNICKNNCLYCGIRAKNASCERYRLTPDEIYDSCVSGYEIGFRTFVLQGGEDFFFTDDVLCELISRIKKNFPDCAVTLSLGERSRESYQALYDAGADRYLLRHEAVNSELYSKLHPSNMKQENRLKCLGELKEIGFQTGCGFMVGAPYQTLRHIAEDLKFVEEFKPEMCGIGPFVPHKNTIFRNEEAGSVELTCYLLSIIRIMHPNILLPATTALGTVEEGGREKGILAGANVIMPNLSPLGVRRKYELYDNKLSTGAESAENIELLNQKLREIGFEIEISRGDIKGE
ncbi:MAG: [Clostridia bacterium]|nr:[FeFe] hydrogenase H-cluster radical SAM maturase HydE [Clostridia bacterium]